MKKILALALAVVFVLVLFVSCGKDPVDNTTDSTTEATTEATQGTTSNNDPQVDINAKSEGVMTYAEFMAAKNDKGEYKNVKVVIEAYVQAKQQYSAQYGNTSLYLQDGDGAYFVYRMPCTQEEYDSLKVGQKVKISGVKDEWSGEVEIIDATFEIEEGEYIAAPVDVTAVLGTDNLINYMNQYAIFSGMTVVAMDDDGNAFYFNHDNSGSYGKDLYFKVSVNGQVYTFTVETDLCDSSTAVYEAVTKLKVGDVINITGFVYWYNGINTHTTSIEILKGVMDKSEGVMTYEEFESSDMDKDVVIEAFIQAKQKYSAQYGNTSLYLQDQDGGYFVYRLACTQEEYDQMTIGRKIKISGKKLEWSGEIEIGEATFELEDGSYFAEAKDVTGMLSGAMIDAYMNRFVTMKGAKVLAMPDGTSAFYYNHDDSGKRGNDLYFKVEINNVAYTFTVESDLCDENSPVYKVVEGLRIGDIIDLEGFLYWYNSPNPHITNIKIVVG